MTHVENILCILKQPLDDERIYRYPKKSMDAVQIITEHKLCFFLSQQSVLLGKSH